MRMHGRRTLCEREMSRRSVKVGHSYWFHVATTYRPRRMAYYGYRYLSTEMGRWANRDPLFERAIEKNLFSALRNTPTCVIDPIGGDIATPLTKTDDVTAAGDAEMLVSSMYWYQDYPGGLYSETELLKVKVKVAIDASLTAVMPGVPPNPDPLGSDARVANFVGAWMQLSVEIVNQTALDCFCGREGATVGWRQDKASVPPDPPLLDPGDNDRETGWYQPGSGLTDVPGLVIISGTGNDVPNRNYKDMLHCRNAAHGSDPRNRLIGTFYWRVRHNYRFANGRRVYTSTLDWDPWVNSVPLPSTGLPMP